MSHGCSALVESKRLARIEATRAVSDRVIREEAERREEAKRTARIPVYVEAVLRALHDAKVSQDYSILSRTDVDAYQAFDEKLDFIVFRRLLAASKREYLAAHSVRAWDMGVTVRISGAQDSYRDRPVVLDDDRQIHVYTGYVIDGVGFAHASYRPEATAGDHYPGRATVIDGLANLRARAEVP
jgi:hypothetical protein